LLLDLDGVSVARVERLAYGRRRIHLVTADERPGPARPAGFSPARWKARRWPGRAISLTAMTDWSSAGTSAAGGAARPTARTGADRRQVGNAAASSSPGARTPTSLKSAVDRGWAEIAAFIDTGHGSAKNDGINRVIKLVARNAFGFRNADNQRLRTRCVTTRRAPRTPLHRSTL